ncbi:MAG: sigma 54-interacting transcriptional regulator [Candidatus Adiutrix sp.]|nr:sigma 54-interacting transcriptional regulator [Candidatus Adiutrix sp.]
MSGNRLSLNINGFESFDGGTAGRNHLTLLKEIKEAKNRFLADGGLSALIRPEVAESWRRCSGRLDPSTHKPAQPSPKYVAELLRKNRLLISHGSTIIDSICENLDESIYYMCLTDSAGRALYINKGYFNKKGPIDFLALGVCFDEESAGANSIALALLHKRDMLIQGAEHFLNPSEAVTCATSIIRDQAGSILGTITITFDIGQYNDLLPGLAATATKLVEERLSRVRYHEILDHVVDNTHESIIVLDSNLKIIKTNPQFLQLLGLNKEDIDLINVTDMFQGLDFKKLLIEKGATELGEVTLKQQNRRCRVNLHIYPVYNDQGLDCLVIFCQEIRSLIIMSRKFSGKTNYYTFKDIITNDPQMVKLIDHCRRIAELDFPILIQGASGVGKELFAQSIHSGGPRADKPFMAVNCAALPLSLIESELFGYEKGAFTGAQTSKPGKFELADDGTIFLDEIGELPLDVQSKLLRVLDNFKVSRIGGRDDKPLNVRLVAATNRNLPEEIARNNFREDLYYRLNVMNITIPPLRERKGDIALLARHFLSQLNLKSQSPSPKVFPDYTLDALSAYRWPGNIREMQNAVIKAYYLCSGHEIEPRHFSFITAGKDANKPRNEETAKSQPISSTERDKIVEALSRCRGNVAEAAAALSMPTSSLYRKIKKYDLTAKNFL